MRNFLKGAVITLFFGIVGGIGVGLLIDANNGVKSFLAGILSVFVVSAAVATYKANK